MKGKTLSLNPSTKHRFQIFKKVDVNSRNYLLEVNGFKDIYCSYLAMLLPLDISEIFNIFRIRTSFSLVRIQEKFRKKPETIVISKLFDEA